MNYSLALLVLVVLFPIKGHDQVETERMKDLLESQSFIFQANSAQPPGGVSVNVATFDNFIKLKEGFCTMRLPYFGTYRLTSGEGLIRADQEIANAKIRTNKKGTRFQLSFYVSNKEEKFKVSIAVGAKGWATVLVKSVNRPTITYYGQLKAL